jgi:sec-independent protein translocase protein TatC
MLHKEPRARSSEDGGEELTVWEHVAELRRYVLLSVGSVLVFGSLTHAYRNELVGLLLRPLGEGMELQFLSPLDPLLFILTLDLMGGVLLSLPVILWGLYRFLTPALPQVRGVWVFLALLACVALGAAALAYGFLVAVPLTLSVLTGITLPGTEAEFTASGYLSFFSTVLLMLVLVFEMPLVMMALSRLGLLEPRLLSRKRGYVYLGLLVGVAMVTPTTDLISLALILLPTYAVFELGLVGARLVTITKH